MKKIVLAYSGGLDTSYCIHHFAKEKGMEVHAILANNGAFNSGDIDTFRSRAYNLGAHVFEEIDITQEYYLQCIRYLIFGNIKRGDVYPLSVSSERMFQALAIARYAGKIKAEAVSHGSTGAGNDQVRFDLVFKICLPEIEIITPIRDQYLSREFEMEYLKRNGISWNAERSTYSINQGIWGTSIGGRETLTSHLPLPENVYPHSLQVTQPLSLSIEFNQGEPVRLNGELFKNPVNLIQQLNQIGYDYAIGRDIHVGDTIIGIKGRVAFEAPAALMITAAHALLEKHVLSKHQIYWKKQLADWYGMMLHEGNYLEPTMRWIETLLEESQKHVNGDVNLTLYPYRFTLDGIQSDFDLMKSGGGVYGEKNSGWTAEEAKGFIQLLSVPLKSYYSLHTEELPI
ncbi:MAG TPA: argininosuccinate synthase [Saprospiraceae bacterium]|nr:argininosuccinate synthase [Saprospiraceae bacterium]